MYICWILKCWILSNSEVTHNIAKIIIDFYKTYCCSCQFDCQMFSSPNWCIKYSWNKFSLVKSKGGPCLRHFCLNDPVTVFLYLIIDVNPPYIWMMSFDWLIQGALLYHFLVCFPLTPHRRGICPLEFRIVSTSQLYQFIGQYLSCYTLGFSIEETNVVGTR
jgi:hypothetical protein